MSFQDHAMRFQDMALPIRPAPSFDYEINRSFSEGEGEEEAEEFILLRPSYREAGTNRWVHNATTILKSPIGQWETRFRILQTTMEGIHGVRPDGRFHPLYIWPGFESEKRINNHLELHVRLKLLSDMAEHENEWKHVSITPGESDYIVSSEFTATPLPARGIKRPYSKERFDDSEDESPVPKRFKSTETSTPSSLLSVQTRPSSLSVKSQPDNQVPHANETKEMSGQGKEIAKEAFTRTPLPETSLNQVSLTLSQQKQRYPTPFKHLRKQQKPKSGLDTSKNRKNERVSGEVERRNRYTGPIGVDNKDIDLAKMNTITEDFLCAVLAFELEEDDFPEVHVILPNAMNGVWDGHVTEWDVGPWVPPASAQTILIPCRITGSARWVLAEISVLEGTPTLRVTDYGNLYSDEQITLQSVKVRLNAFAHRLCNFEGSRFRNFEWRDTPVQVENARQEVDDELSGIYMLYHLVRRRASRKAEWSPFDFEPTLKQAIQRVNPSRSQETAKSLTSLLCASKTHSEASFSVDSGISTSAPSSPDLSAPSSPGFSIAPISAADSQ